MKITEEKGNLFDCKEDYVLVHCISEDCAMGAGIAVEFQRKFNMRIYLLEMLARTSKHYPCAILYPLKKQKVINMITKEKYWHKPTYETLERSLDEVVEICKANGFTKLAMPKIGCGLDRLNWIQVKSLLEEKFKDMPIEILVKYL